MPRDAIRCVPERDQRRVVALGLGLLQLPLAPMVELGQMRDVAEVINAALHGVAQRFLRVAADLAETAIREAGVDPARRRRLREVEASRVRRQLPKWRSSRPRLATSSPSLRSSCQASR